MRVRLVLSHPVLRLACGSAVLVALVWQLGDESFLHGLRSVDAVSLGLALIVALPVTLSCAWRWRIVARRLGIDLPLAAATAAYYRSTFLNCVLPGGVLGDVHRALRHGAEEDDTRLATRAVVGERFLGQAVQVTVACVAVALFDAPINAPGALAVIAALAFLAMLIRRPGVVVASTLAVGGYVAVFMIAAAAVGVAISSDLVPIALVVLVAMALPLNVAGWGPREGVAAWAFAATGIGAESGVATAVAYGVMSLVASLPGAVVLVADRRARGWPRQDAPLSDRPRVEEALHV